MSFSASRDLNGVVTVAGVPINPATGAAAAATGMSCQLLAGTTLISTTAMAAVSGTTVNCYAVQVSVPVASFPLGTDIIAVISGTVGGVLTGFAAGCGRILESVSVADVVDGTFTEDDFATGVLVDPATDVLKANLEQIGGLASLVARLVAGLNATVGCTVAAGATTTQIPLVAKADSPPLPTVDITGWDKNLFVVTGTYKHQWRKCTSFTASGAIATVDPVFVTLPAGVEVELR